MAEKLTIEQQLENLQSVVAQQSEQLAGMQETINQQAHIISEQSKSLEVNSKQAIKIEETTPKKLSIPEKPVDINGKEYKFQVAAFRIPGEDNILSAEEAYLRMDVLEKIIAIKGQQILKEWV